MQSISVNTAQLHELSSRIGQSSRKISDALSELDTKVARLQGSWDGEAKLAYQQAQQEWNKKILEMNDLLSKMSSATAEIASGYTDNDRRGASRFS